MEIDFHLSLIALSERFEFWHDVGSLVHRPVRSAYPAPSQVAVSATVRPSEGIVLGRMTSSEQYFERTRSMIKADHIDSLQLVWLEQGSIQWTAQDNAYHAQAGDLLLLDNCELCQSAWTAHQQIYAVLPRDLVAGPGWQEPGQRVLRSSSPCAAILSHYLHTLWDSQQTAGPSTMQQLAQGLASLTRLYFSETAPLLDAASHPEPIKESIKRWINQQLHNPDLDAAQICSAFFLSRSALYELFKPEGGIRSYVQSCRLERARLILASPDCQASISTIASQLGFRSLSSFSRAFHDRWGVTPRDVRKDALSTRDGTQDTMQLSGQHAARQQAGESVANYYRTVRTLSAREQPT